MGQRIGGQHGEKPGGQTGGCCCSHHQNERPWLRQEGGNREKRAGSVHSEGGLASGLDGEDSRVTPAFSSP